MWRSGLSASLSRMGDLIRSVEDIERLTAGLKKEVAEAKAAAAKGLGLPAIDAAAILDKAAEVAASKVADLVAAAKHVDAKPTQPATKEDHHMDARLTSRMASGDSQCAFASIVRWSFRMLRVK